MPGSDARRPTPRPESPLATAARRWLLATTLAAAGCTTLTPPPLAPDEPRDRVHVLYSTFHSAVALPDGHGAWVQWGFGDRLFMGGGFFVEVLWGPFLAVWGVALPTCGALERRVLRGRSSEQIARETGMDVLSFEASTERIAALRQELEASHAAGSPLEGGFDLRTNSRLYTLWWSNCQDGTADWVRQLGAQLSWTPMRWGPWSRD